MQARQLQNPKTDPYHEIRTAQPQAWRVIRADSRLRRARCRKWRRIRTQSSRSMLLFGPLFFLVWLGISMLTPHDHLLAGIVLLLILCAEAASVIAYLISDAALHR